MKLTDVVLDVGQKLLGTSFFVATAAFARASHSQP